MPDQLQLRGGTTTEHNSFTGAAREVTVDTTKKTLVVHDGSQAGGTALMKESGANAASTVQIGSGGVNALTIDGSQDITLTGASANIVFDKSDNALEFADNAIAKFGNGGDLQVYHDGSNSYLKEDGTGNLLIQANNLVLENTAGTNYFAGVSGGASLVYFNGTEKLATKSDGIDVTGEVQCDSLDVDGGFNIDGSQITYDASSNIMKFTDNAELRFGSGNDLRISHNGTSSIIQAASNDLNIRMVSSENAIVARQNGAVELYYDNSKKFETGSTGVTIIGDLFLDNPDHAGKDVFYDSSLKTFKFDDGVAAKFGSDSDFSIYHNGATGFIQHAGTGQFIIQGNDNDQVKIMKGASEEGNILNNNGNVELYHDGTKRFNTLSNGCEVQGRLGVGDGTDPETTFQVTATAAGAVYPMLLKNRTNGNAAVGMRFLASGADLSDGDFASIEAGHGAVGSTNHEFRFKTCHNGTVDEKLRILSSGGITFNGDSAVANALDDYEEGTWTPSVTGTVSNLGSTSGRAFMYRKIGAVVFFNFDFFQENNNMSVGSDVVIDGLPFDSPNLPNNFLSNISVFSLGGTSSNHANVNNYFSNSAQIVILTAVSGSRHFAGQGFYFVA